jgi:hypothetical protein
MLPVTSCATSSTLGAGTYPVVATYSGDTDNAGSTASTSLTVTRTATSFTASATPSSVSFGTSSVLAAAGLPGDATGSVTFASGDAHATGRDVHDLDAQCLRRAIGGIQGLHRLVRAAQCTLGLRVIFRRHVQRPVKRGVRFSVNAATPSA